MYSHPTPPEVRLSVKRPASLQMHTRYLVTQGAFSERQANRCSTGNIGKPETFSALSTLQHTPQRTQPFCLVSGEDRVWRAPCPNLGLSRVSRVAHLPTQREQKKTKAEVTPAQTDPPLFPNVPLSFPIYAGTPQHLCSWCHR